MLLPAKQHIPILRTSPDSVYLVHTFSSSPREETSVFTFCAVMPSHRSGAMCGCLISNCLHSSTVSWYTFPLFDGTLSHSQSNTLEHLTVSYQVLYCFLLCHCGGSLFHECEIKL